MLVPRDKIWGPGNLLEKQNKGTTSSFYLKQERGSEEVTLIPQVDRYLSPLLRSLVFPLQIVILCLFSFEGSGGLDSILVKSGVLVELVAVKRWGRDDVLGVSQQA